MIALLPVPGGHLTLAERFVDPALSFTLGWLYCELNNGSCCDTFALTSSRVRLVDLTSCGAQLRGCRSPLLVRPSFSRVE